MRVSFALLFALFTGFPSSASAQIYTAAPGAGQIYSWRDANGTATFSNLPPRSGVATDIFLGSNQPWPAAGTAGRLGAGPFDALIAEQAARYGVREDLVRAVVQVESGFNPYARSPKGALGLMQLMPETARRYAVSNPFDPAENVRGGVTYLRHLLDRYNQNVTLALAAYNAGPGAVDKYGQRVPPFRETQNYVASVVRLVRQGLVVNASDSRIIRTTQILKGREVVLYTDRNPNTRYVR
jgi:soluble lytic murein transglycosylase-like protein